MARAAVSKAVKTSRIVIVEDNPADILLVRKALDEKGITFVLTTFEDGLKALTTFMRDDCEVPDAIILDLDLPKTPGVDLLRVVRSKPRFSHVPVIILTSSELPEDKNRSAVLGADCYVKKPLVLGDFLREVGGAVEKALRRAA